MKINLYTERAPNRRCAHLVQYLHRKLGFTAQKSFELAERLYDQQFTQSKPFSLEIDLSSEDMNEFHRVLQEHNVIVELK